MFDDDFFGGGIEDLFNRLAGGNSFVEYSSVGPDGKKKKIRRTQADVFGRALLDKVVTKKKLYFIFDFSGKDDVYANVKDEIVRNDYGEEVATGNKVLEIKSKEDVLSESPLSDKIKVKEFEFVFKNGILEVSFRR